MSYFSNVTPATLPLGLSLVGTTAILFGNLGLSAVGPIPIISHSLGITSLKPYDKVRIWSLFFNNAAKYVVGGTITIAISSSLAAYLTTSQQVKMLALTTAISSLSILPYTLYFIAPTNKALNSMDRAGPGADLNAAKVDELIRTWNRRHLVRYLPFGLSAICSLAALYFERPF